MTASLPALRCGALLTGQMCRIYGAKTEAHISDDLIQFLEMLFLDI